MLPGNVKNPAVAGFPVRPLPPFNNKYSSILNFCLFLLIGANNIGIKPGKWICPLIDGPCLVDPSERRSVLDRRQGISSRLGQKSRIRAIFLKGRSPGIQKDQSPVSARGREGSMSKSLRNVFLFLLLVVFVLLGMHFFPASTSWTIADRFNLDGEANIPEWYSAALLLSVSLVSLAVYLLGRRGVDGDRQWNAFWLAFAGVYCFLSFDECARMHEIFDSATSVKWVYAYAPFAAIFFVVCVFYFVAIRPGEKRVRNWVLGGLIVYALGGLVSEFIGYIFRPLPHAIQQVEFVIEEGLEMIGAIIVLMGVLQELQRLYGILTAYRNPHA